MKTERRGCGRCAAVVLAAVVVLPLLLIALLAFGVLLGVWQHEHGYSYAGAEAKFTEAMNRGESAMGKYWAQRMVDYAARDRRIPDRLQMAYGFLAEAHELAGELEEALSLYEHDGALPVGAARVYFKLGRNEEAFRAYCEFALENKKRLGRRGRKTMTSGEAEGVRILTAGTDTADFPYKRNLIPFRSYMDFMFYMQLQWEKTGNDEKYREAMEYLRQAETPYESETNRTLIESRRLMDKKHREAMERLRQAKSPHKSETNGNQIESRRLRESSGEQ
jgi:tetratricopeptide (TPR) repeat protein